MSRKRSQSKSKKPKSTTREVKPTPAADRTSTPSRGEPAGRRTHEVFGIITMASALLVGPSLVSVQFGSGDLMGPFGRTVGHAINWALGIAGFVVVAALVAVAIRIFAGALGRGAAPPPLYAQWRQRIALTMALVFGAIFLHLAFRPDRLDGASYGGLLGEAAAELLCALVSTPGAWIVCLAGLSLALVLGTRFSWVRSALAAAKASGRALAVVGRSLARVPERLSALGTFVARQIAQSRREAIATNPNGTAAMPPVLRIDLEAEAERRGLTRAEKRAAKKAAKRAAKEAADKSGPQPMPADLEIGRPAVAPPIMLPLPESIDAPPVAAPAPVSRSDAPDEPTLDEVVAAADDDVIIEARSETAPASDADARRAAPKRATPRSRARDDQSTRAEDIFDASELIIEAMQAMAEETIAADDDEPLDARPDEEDVADVVADIAHGARADADSDDEGDELTIVQSDFRRELDAGGEAAAEEQAVREAERAGFVLNGDSYRPPPLSLFEVHESDRSDIDREAIYTQAERLAQTLADYKIFGKVTKVHPGPVVTMYEFVPAPGTRISKIANLSNDLAMSLAAKRVRIVAPIPGKGAIGIEVPNAQREMVSFKEIVADPAFRNPKFSLSMALGKNIFGAPVAVDLAKMPHLLVAGATGAGKSVSVNAMICSLLVRCAPDQVRMIMIDPKFLELSGYNDIPHLLLPVVTDPKQANTALRWAVAEMERRYQLLAEMRVRDIASFNRKVDKLRGEVVAEEAPADGLDQASIEESAPSKVTVVRKNADGTEEHLAGGELLDGADDDDSESTSMANAEQMPLAGVDGGAAGASRSKKRKKRRLADIPDRLPYIVVVIDEFADLMMVASKEVETSVARLAQKARAAGIHVILATQRPSVDVITGLIKANFPSRIAFQVASSHDSKTILNSHGAENLLGSGDMLVLDRGTEMKRVHGAYISDDEIQAVIDHLKSQGRPVYDMDILKDEDADGDGEGGLEDAEKDEMYDRAVQIVAESGKVSISMIQRRLRIGYNRSARIVEMMEAQGIVSEPDGPRGRSVLIGDPR
ncbi:MAG: DNA translocase FtsK 4TM domain-containing protein [Myxococcales bacterium]|nr:DNA translocase FtsK 4TM domain-containing protein [Myxococcales bacterium]